MATCIKKNKALSAALYVISVAQSRSVRDACGLDLAFEGTSGKAGGDLERGLDGDLGRGRVVILLRRNVTLSRAMWAFDQASRDGCSAREICMVRLACAPIW
jgi:hypothetical protein